MDHATKLNLICRICREDIIKDPVDINKYSERIENSYYINTSIDNKKIHPQKMCNKCYTNLRNIEKGSSSSIKPVDWPLPCAGNCSCFPKVVGRKVKKCKPGRPCVMEQNQKRWTRPIINNLISTIPKPTLRLNVIDIDPVSNPHLNLCICKLCNNIMYKPLILKECQHSFCSVCLFKEIEGKLETEAKCFICGQTISLNSVLNSVNLTQIIEHILLGCNKKCKLNYAVKDNELKKLHEENCMGEKLLQTFCKKTPSGLDTTLSDIFLLKGNDVIPRIVEDAALHVIKQKQINSESNFFSFPSGGPRPLQFTSNSMAYKDSSDVSKRTIRKRHLAVINSLNVVPGLASTSQLQQTSAILNSFGEKDQIKILKMSNIPSSVISAEEMVSMKAHMGITYSNMKIIARWLKTNNIKCASNKKQRKVAKSWSGEDWVICNAPFNFPLKDSIDSFEIKNAPWGYIKDFPSHIINKLNLLKKWLKTNNIKCASNKKQRKVAKSWSGEDWVICNAPFNFPLKDSIDSFEIKNAPWGYIKDFPSHIINKLNLLKNEKKIRVFIFGDYEFLCSAYGITGANGRHACLFCHITREEMKMNPSQQKHSCSKRTLETLHADFQNFIQKGRIPKLAKTCNNVIDLPLFNIPLTQVSIPSLHISLGIYLKFFNMLEDGCHLLDVKIAAKMCMTNQTVNNRNFDEYIALQLKIYEGEKVINEYCEKITLIHEAMAIHVLRSPENKEIICEIFQPRVAHYMEKKNAKLIELEELRSKTFEKSHGPLVKKLDEVLCGLHVQRQAYHGKCFIGNHVHKMLKLNSILDLCNSIPKIVSDLGYIGTDVHNEAKVLSKKFVALFSKYSTCYNFMNSSEIINKNPISELERAIDKLMSYFRKTWPNESITPKMHLLESHCVDFIRNWNSGLDIYGEQGLESMHAEFNSMNNTFCHMKGKQRLRSILSNHYIKNSPEALIIRPTIKKRKPYKRKA
nr:uncharacterized protein LOC124812047 isoform X3 [Hydra vulgaris]